MKPLLNSQLTVLCIKPFLNISLPKVHSNWTHLSHTQPSPQDSPEGLATFLFPCSHPERRKMFSCFAPQCCFQNTVLLSSFSQVASTGSSPPSIHCLHQYPESSSSEPQQSAQYFSPSLLLRWWSWDLLPVFTWHPDAENPPTHRLLCIPKVPLQPPDHYDQTLDLSSKLNGHTFKIPNSEFLSANHNLLTPSFLDIP